ncbi:MAG: MMPL family transporter [Alphaproteobacteria bacterium]|nr:MMPL family transporter [Alphaproteobacteria bacterium]
MPHPLARLARWCAAHPALTVAVHLALLLAAGVYAGQRLSQAEGPNGVALALFDNSPERVWGEGSEPLQQYHRFRDRFGADGIELIAVHAPDTLDVDDLDVLDRFADSLAEEPGWSAFWAGDLPYAPRERSDGSLAVFLETLDQDPGARRLLHAEDGGWTAGVLLVLAPEVTDDVSRRAIAPTIRSRWDEVAPPGWTMASAGTPSLFGALGSAVVDSMQVNLPVANGVVLLLAAWAFRRPWMVFAAMAALLQGEALVLAAFVGSGRSFNYVSCYMAICVVVVGFAANIHLFARYTELRRGKPHAQALAQAADGIAGPVTASLLTTSGAMLALAGAEQTAIVEFGAFSAGGIAAVLLCAFTLGPALLTLGGGPVAPTPRLPDPSAIGAWAWRNAGAVLTGTALAAALAGWGVSRLALGSSVEECFTADHPVTRSVQEVRARMGAFSNMEVVLSWPKGGAGDLVRTLRTVEDALVTGLTPERGPVQAGDVLSLAGAGRAFCLAPGTAFFCAPDGLPKPQHTARLMDRLQKRFGLSLVTVDEDGVHARVSVLLDLPEARASNDLAAQAEVIAREAAPDARIEVTGFGPLWSSLEEAIVDDLLRSFLWSAGVVAGLLLLLLRSVRLWAVALPANALPLLGVAGTGGAVLVFGGMHVNSTAAMVLTVTIGIIVDDTLFFLLGLKRRGDFSEAAVRDVLREVGPGIVLTSLCLGLGFATLGASSFVNAQVVGLASATVIAVALLGDLLVLPACVRVLAATQSPRSTP